jgi:hypothetical protein
MPAGFPPIYPAGAQTQIPGSIAPQRRGAACTVACAATVKQLVAASLAWSCAADARRQERGTSLLPWSGPPPGES